jgi:glyceraldehyde-3-phosphate dehydrogenase (NADP+)
VRIKDKIEHIFPDESAIPDKWRMTSSVRQRRFLAGGRLVEWDGPFQEVLSPIRTPGPSGPVPKVIGTYPLLTTKESMAALGEAVTAYGRGTGVWPAIPVARRIGHLRRFMAGLEEKRDEIIRLLMWETAKTFPPSRQRHPDPCRPRRQRILLV